MYEPLILEAAGYQILFDFQPHPRSHDALNGKIRLETTSDFHPRELETKPFMLLISDYLHFADYLETHIEKLIAARPDRSYSEAYVFLDDSLAHMIQALSGDVPSPTRGSFTLQVMPKVGFDQKMRKAVYGGIRTTVYAADVTAFIATIRERYKLPESE